MQVMGRTSGKQGPGLWQVPSYIFHFPDSIICNLAGSNLSLNFDHLSLTYPPILQVNNHLELNGKSTIIWLWQEIEEKDKLMSVQTRMKLR